LNIYLIDKFLLLYYLTIRDEIMDIKHIKNLIRSVPFGNSQFQINTFVGNDITPERTYRNVLLQLNQKLNALQECSFRRRRKEIDIKEIEQKLSKRAGMSTYEPERLKIDLEEATGQLENEIKLIEDAEIEIQTYLKILDSLPEITREQFENSEKKYWQCRLLKDAQREIQSMGHIDRGTLQALEQTGLKVSNTIDGKLNIFGSLSDEVKEYLELKPLETIDAEDRGDMEDVKKLS
jgi:hypothetical protein